MRKFKLFTAMAVAVLLCLGFSQGMAQAPVTVSSEGEKAVDGTVTLRFSEMTHDVQMYLYQLRDTEDPMFSQFDFNTAVKELQVGVTYADMDAESVARWFQSYLTNKAEENVNKQTSSDYLPPHLYTPSRRN